MKVRGVVFDLDGTLVDNMAFHFQAWQALAKKLGIPVTAEQFERDFAGRKNDEIFERLYGRAMPAAEVRALGDEKEANYRELYRPHLQPARGALDLIARLKAKGIKIAIATAAPPLNRKFVLEGLDWLHTFDAIQGSEGLRGKPAPDIFAKAAEALQVEARECVAFEDAVLGVQSARAAGMQVAGILSTTPAELPIAAGASWTARDFASLPPALLSLLQQNESSK